MSTYGIDRLAVAPTYEEFFEKYLKPNKPVIIPSDLLESWPAFREWGVPASLDAAAGNSRQINWQLLADAYGDQEVNVADYDAVFYPGGHGPMLDLASDPVNAKLASDFWQAGKIVSAVCHGPGCVAAPR